jgi:hypothetical protein
MKTTLIVTTLLAFALCGFVWAAQIPQPQRLESEAQILQQLEMPITLVPLETPGMPLKHRMPLNKAVQLLCEQAGIQHWNLDESALREAGVLTDIPVQIPQGRMIPMKSFFNTILEQHGLAYVVANELLTITTKRKAKGNKYPKSYYVGDIVNFDVEAADPVAIPMESMFTIIRSVIEPDSWMDGDSQIAMVFDVSTKSLTIRQTEDAHAQIEELINAIRKLNEEKQPTLTPPKRVEGEKYVEHYYVGDIVKCDLVKFHNTCLTGTPLKPIFDTIRTIEPDTWKEEDSFIYIADTNSLAIQQTERVHAQIANILNQMRKANEKEQQTSAAAAETEKNSRPLSLRERVRGRILTATNNSRPASNRTYR